MLSVEAAREMVLANVTRLPAETVTLTMSHLGHVLAEPICADLDSPPFDKAMMDGFAIRTADCGTLPVTLTIIEEITAGKTPTQTVGANQASRIMTGAPIPPGADAVVQIERTHQPDAMHVTINESKITPRQHILDRGREMRVGDIVLAAGHLLRAPELGLLATLGQMCISIVRSPTVSILCTGDEIIEPDRTPVGSQIRNSNGPMLTAQTIRAGATPRYLGIAVDQLAELRAHVRSGLDGGDVLILAGGVSMGTRDLVPEVLAEFGIVPHFHKVAMKPGKPLFFGTFGEKRIFGLPGNPVSAFVCFELFVRPALAKMRGLTTITPTRIRLPLAADFISNSDRQTFYPATLELTESGLIARPIAWFGSADLRALTRANALIDLPAGEVRMTAGAIVDVVLTDGL